MSEAREHARFHPRSSAFICGFKKVWAICGSIPLLAGCGPPPAPVKTVSFATARQAAAPVTIEGRPEQGSLRQETGKPTEFSLFEESSANRMVVSAPSGVSVPSNLKSATAAIVTGTYDATQRKLIATEVQTRVPTREQQH